MTQNTTEPWQALEDRLRIGQFGNEEEALTIRREEERRRKEADGEIVPAMQQSLFEIIEPEATEFVP